MTQYNKVNVKSLISQLNKLKSAIKNENDVVIRLSPNIIGDSNDKGNFPHELSLTNRQVSSIRKAFANNSSVDIKFSKAQLSKMIQSGEFLVKLLGHSLTLKDPVISESCIEIKIKLNFYFHMSLCCLKRFHESL